MARLITAPPKFKILVANLQGSGDPSQGLNPTKIRTGFEQQVFSEIARGSTRSQVEDPSAPGLHSHQGLLTYTTSPIPVASSGTITVADNDFSDEATLNLGDYVLVSGEDYTPGGTTALTAAAIGAAIEALPEFSASVVGSTVTVSGPFGPTGNDLLFEALYRGSVQNFTLDPTDGYFDGAEPTIGPPTLLT